MTLFRPLLALLAATLLAVLGYTAAGATGPDRAPREERPVIVEVTGDALNGFEITRADGTQLFPPTDSEASAECGEYDRMRQRVRCRTEVRTWYRDLGDLQRSLAWVREHG